MATDRIVNLLRLTPKGPRGPDKRRRACITVAIGAARGLEYFHEAAAPRILHRDITYLGMAKSLVIDGILSCSSSPAHMQGTFGYFAPKYAIVGRASLMSDVFSFGAVLLELISGRHPIYKSPNKGEEILVIWATPLLPNPCLKGNFEEEELQVMAYLAKECILLDPDACPIMSEVVQILLKDDDKDPIRESKSPENLKQVIFQTSNPKSSYAGDDEVIVDLTEPRFESFCVLKVSSDS
ncbi:receptor-like serine/threonine-protein kinase NCRK [Tanacetum coccineum]